MNILLKITLLLCFISCKVTDKNEIITITGIAENRFIGASLISNEHEGNVVFYLEGMNTWPSEVLGELVEVKGQLNVKHYPRNKETPFLQQYDGDLRTILKPIWKIIE